MFGFAALQTFRTTYGTLQKGFVLRRVHRMEEIMKRKASALLALLLALNMTACSGTQKPQETTTAAPAATEAAKETTTAQETPAAEGIEALQKVEDGSYEGTGKGHGGDVKVTVEIKGHMITLVQVTEHQETQGISDKPLADVPQRIVDEQSLAVDTVSGATETSMAILGGAEEALKAAGADIALLKEGSAAEKTAEHTEREADIVIVGGGVAGLTAAVEASATGLDVVLIEKMGMLGGSTALSGGKILAAGSVFQKEQGIEDTPKEFYDFMIGMGEGLVNEDKLKMIAEGSAANIDWLMEQGVEFSGEIDTPNPAMKPNRGLTVASGSGMGFITPLEEKAAEQGVEIMLETRGTKLLKDDKGAICGVEALQSSGDTITFHSKAVILATGGYDRNEEVKQQYSPTYANSRTNVGAGNTGDGLIMAREIGANIIGNDSAIAQIAAYGAAAKDMFTFSGLYVSIKGERFMDESSPRPVRTPIVLRKTNAPEFYMIIDSKGATEGIETAVKDKTAFKADTLEELAQAAGMEPELFVKSVERYNELKAKGVDEDFGKSVELMDLIEEAPFYAIHCNMNTAGTFGGPQTDLEAQVLDTEGHVIPGLYAAGEVSSGDLINKEYPGSGMAIQTFVTMGRIAGKNSLEYVTNN